MYSYDDFIGGSPQPIYQGGITQTPFLYQLYSGSWWLSENLVFGGAPIGLVHKDIGQLIIPDVMQKLVYVIDGDVLKGRELNAQLSEVEAKPRKIQLPAETKKHPERLFGQHYRRSSYLLDYPIAVTMNDLLALFVIDLKDGSVLQARTAPFVAIEERAAAAVTAPGGAGQQAPNSAANVSEAEDVVAAPSVVSEAVVDDLLSEWPRLVVVGAKFEFRFPVPGSETEVALVEGPTGMKISEGAVLTWTPAADDVGQIKLKIRVERPSGPYFARPEFEVISADLAKLAGGDLSKVNQFQKLDLDLDHYSFAESHDRKSLLLLQGSKLRRLKEDGLTIDKETELPARYQDIEEREDVYIGVSSQPPFVDIIDKRSLRVNKHIELRFAEFKVMEVTDLAIHPDRPLSCVGVEYSIELPRFKVLFIDEKSGIATDPDIPGNWAEFHPDGRTLLTGYSDIYEKGVHFHVNPGWRLIKIPDYGNVDMLMSWDLIASGRSVRQVVRQAGGNGTGIRVSPDFSRLVYLSHVGTPQHSRNLAGFDVGNFEQPAVNYETKDRASTKEAAFHPSLPWIAMPGNGTVAIFHMHTGAVLENRLLATLNGLGAEPIERLLFAPDGQSILLLRSGGDSGRYLQRVPLRLEPTEMISTPRKRDRPRPKQVTQPIVKFEELTTLQEEPGTQPMTPLEIGREFNDSVVVVRSKSSSGTGFVVGKAGCILTCAHVVSGEDQVTIFIRSSESSNEFGQAAATVVHINESRDLALLRIDSKQQLKAVRFRKQQTIETGEPVTVIGNPGAGDSLLSHTMTSGIVSNPNRDIDGQKYFQLSAAVNPGNSGGPLFDQQGNVAGLVALKADIEGAGFAVPAERLREFLIEAIQKK